MRRRVGHAARHRHRADRARPVADRHVAFGRKLASARDAQPAGAVFADRQIGRNAEIA
jgi:hypothetical protein